MSTQPPTDGSSDETVVTPVVSPAPVAPRVPDDVGAPTYGTTSPSYGAPSVDGAPGSPTEQISYAEQSLSAPTAPVHSPPQPTYGPPTEAFGAPAASPGAPPAPYGSPVGWAEQSPYGGWNQQPPQQQAPAGWWTPQGTPTGPSGPEGYSYPAGGVTSSSSAVGAFLSKVFSLSFASFVTASMTTFVYASAMVIIGILWLVYSVAAFVENAGLGLLVLFVIGPAVSLVSLVVVRILLEVCVAVVGLAEDAKERRAGTDGDTPSTPSTSSTR